MKNYTRAILAFGIAAAFTSQVSFAQGFGYFNYNHHYNHPAPASYAYGSGYVSGASFAAPVAAYAPAVRYAPAAPVYAPAAYVPVAGYGHVQSAPTYSLRLVRRYAVRRPRPVVVQPAPQCNVCQPSVISD